jgi:hypothetical protein
MFDALEKMFKGTEQENLINELYQGKIKDYVKCLEVKYAIFDFSIVSYILFLNKILNLSAIQKALESTFSSTFHYVYVLSDRIKHTRAL